MSLKKSKKIEKKASKKEKDKKNNSQKIDKKSKLLDKKSHTKQIKNLKTDKKKENEKKEKLKTKKTQGKNLKQDLKISKKSKLQKNLKKDINKKANNKATKKNLIVKNKIAKENLNIKKNIPAKKITKKNIETKLIDFPTNSVKNAHAIQVFKAGDYAVYPSHGIGKIVEIQKTTILGSDLSCYLMHFEKEKLTIKVPLKNAEKIGLRPLASKMQMEEVFSILRSGIKKLKGMWSRRAQEYEAKINSGDIVALAEVLRDLTRDIEDGERSYSERIIYETAVLRLAAEYSAIHNVDFEEAKNKVVLTAKDKIGSDEKQEKPSKRDDFEFEKDISSDSEEEISDEDDDDDDEDDEDEDDEDESPRKKKRK